MSRPSFIPEGFATEAESPDLRRRLQRIPVAELKRLPGALGFAFEILADGNLIAVGTPLVNPGGSPLPTSNFTVGGGFEGLIDWLMLRHLDTINTQSVWNAALIFNGVPVPGYEFIGALKATGNGVDWWTECEEYVPENTLVQLQMANFAAGGSFMVGGRVHGWYWPIQARLDWEAAHPET